jgi:hypothetical protein
MPLLQGMTPHSLAVVLFIATLLLHRYAAQRQRKFAQERSK